jgi:putative peptide zinc metalloprotease protein
MDRSVSAGRTALPSLREELRLAPGAANANGSPAWVMHDPVNNRFFRIGWLDFEILLRWSQGSAEQIVAQIRAETTLHALAEDVDALAEFLVQHCLIRIASTEGAIALQRRAQGQAAGWRQQLLRHYLFFRVPLVHPQFWLARMVSHLAWLFSGAMAGALLLVSLLGLFLVTRQWDVFVHTFVDQLSWSGLFGYACALVVAKTLHEAGHALTAARYGVRVAHMGIAWVVFFPMLYTDTSESWKLTNPRQRLAIASAGIVVELALAALATLAWSLAPDGSVRNALFYLASTGWLLSLAINASPFMRFDGYFILCDLFDLPNLHERSAALARTWVRRVFLGLPVPWPERLPGYGNALMIGFAVLTWFYRLAVFFGIALIVYHSFFKVLGLALFGLEIYYFILRPIFNEIRAWYALREKIKPWRRRMAWSLPVLLLISGLLPWPGHVAGSGWLHASRQHIVHAPFAGRLVSLPSTVTVDAGQALFLLEAPELAISAGRANALAAARGRELLGLIGLPEGEARRSSVEQQQAQFVAEEQLYRQEQRRLQLVSPFAGQLRDLDENLQPGVWVHPRQPLAIIIDAKSWVVDALVEEADIARLAPGNRARVLIEGQRPYFLSGQVSEIDAGRTQSLPHLLLDAKHGGPLPTVAGAGGESVLRDARYRVRIVLDAPPLSPQMAVARVDIEGAAQAWLGSILERWAALLIRESGF